EAIQVRSSTGALTGQQTCPAYVDGTAYAPLIPNPLPSMQPAPDGTKAVYFTAPSTKAGGPTFRVRASTLTNGDYLIVAQPIGDTDSTLHHLLLVELIVTGGAVVLAL